MIVSGGNLFVLPLRQQQSLQSFSTITVCICLHSARLTPVQAATMASSSDVRAILSLPPAGGASSSSFQAPTRKLVHPTKKPDGISRELYALMGDNAPSLISAQSLGGGDKGKVRYKEAKGMRGKKVKW